MNAPLRRGLPDAGGADADRRRLLARLDPIASGLSPKVLIGLCEAVLRQATALSR